MKRLLKVRIITTLVVLLLVLGILVSKNVQINQLTESLIKAGVSANCIAGYEYVPANQTRADEIANYCFHLNLQQRGIPKDYFEKMTLLSLADADSVSDSYFREDLLARGLSKNCINDVADKITTTYQAENIGNECLYKEFEASGVDLQLFAEQHFDSHQEAIIFVDSYFRDKLLVDGIEPYVLRQHADYIIDKDQANRIAQGYFVADLIERGVPKDIVIGAKAELISVNAANRLAQNYFADYLVRQGVPSDIVDNVELELLDIEATRAIAKEYFQTLLLERGVPESVLTAIEAPLSLIETNRITREYFVGYLIERGVPLDVVNNAKSKLLNIELTHAIAGDYFQAELLDRGVPESVLVANEILLSLAEANQIAQESFAEFLMDQGVAEQFIDEHSEYLLSQHIADELLQTWYGLQGLENASQQMVADLDELNKAIADAQLNTSEEIIDELDSHLQTMIAVENQRAEEHIDKIMTDMIADIVVCSGTEFIPVFGDATAVWDAIRGRDRCTGEDLALWEKFLNVISIIPIFDFVKAGDKAADLLKVFDRLGNVGEFLKKIRNGIRSSDVQRVVAMAEHLGYSHKLDELLELTVLLNRTGDLRDLRRAADILSSNKEFRALVDALDALEDVKTLESITDANRASELTKRLNALENVKEALKNSSQFESVVSAVATIQRMPALESMQSAERYIKDSNRINRLTVFERAFRAIGGIDTVKDGLIFAKTNNISVIVSNLAVNKHIDYLNFVQLYSTNVRRTAWLIRARHIIGQLKFEEAQFVVLNHRLVADVNHHSKEVWLFPHIEDKQADFMFRKIEYEIENLASYIEDGYATIYYFDTKPDRDISDLIRDNSGAVFWGDENPPQQNVIDALKTD